MNFIRLARTALTPQPRLTNSQLQTLKSLALVRKPIENHATTKFHFSRLQQPIDSSLLSHIHYTIII